MQMFKKFGVKYDGDSGGFILIRLFGSLLSDDGFLFLYTSFIRRE